MSNPFHVQRARRACAVRFHGPDSAEAVSASRDLAAAKLERYVAAVVDAAPPLTPEQRDRIAAILRGGDAA